MFSIRYVSRDRLSVLLLLVLLIGITASTVNAFASEVIVDVTTVMFIQMLVVVALHVFTGLSGVISFGHYAFVAVGAYSASLLTIPPALKQSLFPDFPKSLDFILKSELGFVPASILAGLVAVVAAALFAPFLCRLSGGGAAIGSFGVLAIMQILISQTDSVTRGTSSMIGTPPNVGLWSAAAFAVGAVVLAYFYQRSSSALQLMASRDEPIAAQSAGISVPVARSRALLLSAFLAGVGGALYAQYVPTYGPDAFYLAATFSVIIMLVAGGRGSLTGAVVGPIVITAVSELLRTIENSDVPLLPEGKLAGISQLVLCLILLVTLIRWPRGLLGTQELGFARKGNALDLSADKSVEQELSNSTEVTP